MPDNRCALFLPGGAIQRGELAGLYLAVGEESKPPAYIEFPTLVVLPRDASGRIAAFQRTCIRGPGETPASPMRWPPSSG